MPRRTALPLLIVILSVSAFATVGARGQRIQQALAPTVGDLAAARSVELVDSAGTVLLTGVFATVSEDDEEIEREAELKAPTGAAARGEAEIEVNRNKGRTVKDEIELKAEGLPASAICKLLVDGEQVSEFTTTKKGRVDLKLTRKM